MDFFSVSTTMSVIAFFVFLCGFFFYVRSDKKDNYLLLLLISSALLCVSILMFHFEFRLIASGSSYAYFFSFLSATTLMGFIFTVTYMIGTLYHDQLKYNKFYYVSYSIFVGVAMALNTIYGTYFSSFIIITICLLPFGYILLKAMLQSKESMLKSPFVYQLGLLGFFFILKMNNLFHNQNISPLNPNSYDNYYTMLSLMILIMFNITFMLEYNHMLNKELQTKSQSLSQSLYVVKKESETDTLTRIPNRGKMKRMLEVYFETFKEYDTNFLIAMIDLNNFKKVNDKYGHQAGDKLLREIANNLTKVVRVNDIVGRWGGDEFLIIFPNTSLDVLDKIKENLVFGFDLLGLPIESVKVSLSIGIASASECKSYKELIHLADSRMYLEKNISLEK